jgi:hypothetical protein
MYWNNPTIKLEYPSNVDPILQSFHDGNHVLFYDACVPKDQICYKQTLQDICDWANDNIKSYGIAGFINQQKFHYDIANIVKLNMWIYDIQKQGIVKPMMLFYDGSDKFGINNGESRLRALERISTITTIPSFISTRAEHASRFKHLEQITDLDHFAEICQAVPGQKFLFTLTDQDAPYGIFWYEYDSQRTAPVTPGESYCVEVLHLYLTQHPEVEFTPEWFDTPIEWNHYKSNN